MDHNGYFSSLSRRRRVTAAPIKIKASPSASAPIVQPLPVRGICTSWLADSAGGSGCETGGSSAGGAGGSAVGGGGGAVGSAVAVGGGGGVVGSAVAVDVGGGTVGVAVAVGVVGGGMNGVAVDVGGGTVGVAVGGVGSGTVGVAVGGVGGGTVGVAVGVVGVGGPCACSGVADSPDVRIKLSGDQADAARAFRTQKGPERPCNQNVADFGIGICNSIPFHQDRDTRCQGSLCQLQLSDILLGQNHVSVESDGPYSVFAAHPVSETFGDRIFIKDTSVRTDQTRFKTDRRRIEQTGTADSFSSSLSDHMDLQIGAVKVDMIDGTVCSAHAAVYVRAFKGRSRSSRTGETSVFVSENNFSVRPDIEEKAKLGKRTHVGGKYTCNDISPYVSRKTRQHEYDSRLTRKAELRGRKAHQVSTAWYEGRGSDVPRVDSCKEVDHRGVPCDNEGIQIGEGKRVP